MNNGSLESSTTTAIQLEHGLQDNIQHRDARNHATRGVNEVTDVDPVLEASRIADSSVADGGHGWVVVTACAVVCFWFTGCNYSWGVVQNALAEQNLASVGTLSFLGSISPALMAILGVVIARVIQRIGIRLSSILGIVLLGAALILSSFSVRSVAGQFITRGVVLGISMSLCFMVTSVIPAQYFSRNRGLANGIVSAGGGLGGATVSYALDAMIQRFGIAWAYRILGLVALATGLPAACIVQERAPIKTTAFIEWPLFKNSKFVIMFVASSVGLSSSTGAGLLAGFNFSSAVGRFLAGILSDKLGPLNTLIISLMLNAICMLALWPLSTTLGPLAAFAVSSGASNGMYFATTPTVVGNTLGSARVSVAFGMIVAGWGPGYFMGAPIAGYLLDAYGGSENGLRAFRPAMFYAGSLALGAAGLITLLRLRLNLSPLTRI